MKEIVLTVFLTILSITASYGQNNKTGCQDIDYYVKKTIEAINKKDAKQYMSLINFDVMLEMLKDASKIDTTVQNLYLQLRSNRTLFYESYKSNFTKLASTIEKQLNSDQWVLEIVDYKIENEQQDTYYTHFTLAVNLKYAKKGKWNIGMFVGRYRDCYYIFVPIEPHFMPGWY